jgi:tRNA pseudouridine38-40 synthase
MKYCLLEIAYDDSFYGFQVQPDVKTVQGEIVKALAPIGIKKVYGSSRTDAHVKSASSIIEVEHDDVKKVCKIVDSLKGIAVLGFYEADEFVNLRKKFEKEYLYFCDHGLNKKVLQRTIREFLKGKLESFSRDPSKRVALSKIEFSIGKTHTIFLFEGRSFSWNFVRISAESIIKRSDGSVSDEEWSELLSGKRRPRYKGKPNNLILYRTKTPFEFKRYESRNLATLRARIFQDFYWISSIDDTVRELTDSINFLGL